MHGGWTVARAQAALGEAAFDLLALRDRLERINRGLPLPANIDAILEAEAMPDVASALSGCLDCLVNDYLRLAIEMLERAAHVTAADLEQDFKRRRKGGDEGS